MDHSEVKHLPKVDHTPAELDPASKLLLKASDMLEQGKWYPGDGGIADGARCAWEAIVYSDPNSTSSHFGSVANAAGYRLARALGYENMITPIFKWNDTATKQIVLAKLRAVALGL